MLDLLYPPYYLTYLSFNEEEVGSFLYCFSSIFNNFCIYKSKRSSISKAIATVLGSLLLLHCTYIRIYTFVDTSILPYRSFMQVSFKALLLLI